MPRVTTAQHHRTAHAVFLLPVTERPDGKWLLLSEQDKPVEQYSSLFQPSLDALGGKAEKGEDCAQALAREVHEEVGGLLTPAALNDIKQVVRTAPPHLRYEDTSSIFFLYHIPKQFEHEWFSLCGKYDARFGSHFDETRRRSAQRLHGVRLTPELISCNKTPVHQCKPSPAACARRCNQKFCYFQKTNLPFKEHVGRAVKLLCGTLAIGVTSPPPPTPAPSLPVTPFTHTPCNNIARDDASHPATLGPAMSRRAQLDASGLQPTPIRKRLWPVRHLQPAVAQPPAPAAPEASPTLTQLEQAETSEADGTVHEVMGAPLPPSTAVCSIASPHTALVAAPSSMALVASPSTALVASPSTILVLASEQPATTVTTLVAAGPPTMTLGAVPTLNATGAVEVSDSGSQAALALASTADVTLHSLVVPSDTAMALTSAGSELDSELDSERDLVGEIVALETRSCLGLLTCSATTAVANGRESRASQNTQTYAELLSAPEVSGGAVGTDDLDGTVHSAAGGINADDSVAEGCDADTEFSDNEEVGASDDSGHDTEIEDDVIEIGADAVLDECKQVHPDATQADQMDAEDAPVDDEEAEPTEVESYDEAEPTQLESDDEVAPKGDTVSPQTTTPTALHPNVQSGIPVAVVGTIVSERPAEQEEMTTTMTVTTTTMTTCEANGLISTLEEATTTTTTTTTTVRRPKRKASELAAVRVKQQVQGENDGVIEAIREAERHALEAVIADMPERKKEKLKRAQATWHPDTDIEDGDEADRDEDYAVRSKVRRPKKQRRTQVASIMTPSHPVMTTSASSNGATYDAPIDLTAD